MNLDIKGSKIVIADDSITIISKLKMLLSKQGYEVYSATDGKQCVDLIDSINPDLVILDLQMPYMTGLDVCKYIRGNERTNLLPVIILTALDIKEAKNNAISAGANDFLYKTYDTFELKLKVESLLKLNHAIKQLENANNIIKSLAKAVEVKDKYTVGHAERVSMYAADLGKIMNLSEQQVKDLAMGGLLHDIGKIGVPDSILNKDGKLSDEEYDVIKMHPVIGEEICIPIKSLGVVKKIIRHHHEKLNGKGYPDGIGKDKLSIETRIMTVVDIYDAVTSDRAYRKSMSQEKAFKILFDSVSNGELDRDIVNIFVNHIRNAQIQY